MKPAHWFLPYDLYERHAVVAQMIAAHGSRGLRVLDVGGRAGLLSRFTPCSVISANVDRSGEVRCDGMALPFPNAAFDITVTIDTLEHMPRERRPAFVRECLRVSAKALIVAAPFGSPGHAEAETRLHALFQALTGQPHPYLAEHVAYGLPDIAEIQHLATCSGARLARLAFAGDYRREAHHFAAAIRSRTRRGWRARGEALLWHWRSRALLTRLHLSNQPQPHSNRFFMELLPG